MPNDAKPALRRETPLTPKADKQGHEILVCDPEWFDEKKKYKITNAPVRTADLEFSGADLNYMARVLYAEAAGSAQLTDKATREKEKSAIMNVNHFRLNRKGYPNRHYVAKTFREVCDAPGQFESVFAGTPKFGNSAKGVAVNLKKSECADLCEAIAAISAFLAKGPTEEYQFDNFRGYDPKGQGTHIGRSRFWLSTTGQTLRKSAP